MPKVPLEEVQTKLSELIHKLKPGEVLVITENGQPVAKLIGEAPTSRKPRQRGSAKGNVDAELDVISSTVRRASRAKPQSDPGH